MHEYPLRMHEYALRMHAHALHVHDCANESCYAIEWKFIADRLLMHDSQFLHPGADSDWSLRFADP